MPVYSGLSTGAFRGTISFEWIPEPEVIAAALIETSEYLEDRSAPLALSRQVAQDDMRERFETKTSPEGAAWAPWAESYAPIAAATNVGGLLERTGAMRAAALSEAAYPITKDSVFFDTSNLPFYWIYHQLGASRGAEDEWFRSMQAAGLLKEGATATGVNFMPARPFVGTSFEAQLRILEVFDQWFAGAVAVYVTGRGRLGRRHSLRGPGGRFVSA